jgi:hypothetical protein
LLGIAAERAAVDFEVELPNGDGTNIDVLITESSGRRAVVEIKLTEASFGRARHDERHLHKLKRVYGPVLWGRLPDPLLVPSVFFRDYQLFRNLAQLRPGANDRLLLVLPRARTELWQFATAWCARSDLGAFCGVATVVALEDLVAALQTDAHATRTDTTAFAAISAKYVAVAG